MTLVFTDNLVSFFLDGSFKPMAYSGCVTVNDIDTILLGLHHSNSYVFSGYLDEFRVYSSVDVTMAPTTTSPTDMPSSLPTDSPQSETPTSVPTQSPTTKIPTSAPSMVRQFICKVPCSCGEQLWLG